MVPFGSVALPLKKAPGLPRTNIAYSAVRTTSRRAVGPQTALAVLQLRRFEVGRIAQGAASLSGNREPRPAQAVLQGRAALSTEPILGVLENLRMTYADEKPARSAYNCRRYK